MAIRNAPTLAADVFAAFVKRIAPRMLAWYAVALFPIPAHAASFQVSVPIADSQGHIKRTYVYDASGCRGENHAPPIRWSNVPAGARSYAITVHDPDASGGWWHWIVVNMPAGTRALGGKAGLPPGALALRNSFGHAGWGGPCPPVGNPPHHYVFSVYALNVTTLDLATDATPAQAMTAIHAHTLAVARVVYTYGR